MKYRVQHTTTYAYNEMVLLCHNEVHLTPRNTAHQTRGSMQLGVAPEPAVCSDYVDYFGNNATFFTVQERHRELKVTATSDVDVVSNGQSFPQLTPAWEDIRESLTGENLHKHIDAVQF